MHYYIDGYNLLFRISKDILSLREKRELLLSSLATLNINVTVVFDSGLEKHGVEDRSHWQEIEIIYAEKGLTADAHILRELSLSNTPQREVVITSDLKLADQCRRLGAKTQTIEAFLEKMAKRRLKQHPRITSSFKESQKEIDRLLKIFENRLEHPSDDF